ncbi:heat shock protein [Xanthomonas vesicatoria ATCC 35937]|uniref:Heat shock protein n=1 Tax=Xanthomonas vesicatoria ATCC 35937 TaxID=925775 RepID=F1W5B9_9XANT|nr:heat shock protein [Xanthomonas vesicatoria ATCC 35937]
MRAVFFAPALLAAGVTACGSGATPGAGGGAPDTPAASTAAAAPVRDNAPLRTALQAQHWQLQQASDAHGTGLRSLFVAGSAPLQLDFADQRIQVSETCNALGANYSVADTQLQIGRVVSSKRLCTQPQKMPQERAASEALSGRFAVTLDTAQAAPRLTLTRSDGTRLLFNGMPTASTRYGEHGQTLLIEVAADTAPCAPTRPAPACNCASASMDSLRPHPGKPSTARLKVSTTKPASAPCCGSPAIRQPLAGRVRGCMCWSR